MPQAYLPGDTRQRIRDLIKDNDITRAEPASRISLYGLPEELGLSAESAAGTSKVPTFDFTARTIPG